jgi:hypothetical protein
VRRPCARLLAAALTVCTFQAGAAGLRSFAALPLGKGAGVARVMLGHEFDADSTRAETIPASFIDTRSGKLIPPARPRGRRCSPGSF